LATTQARNNKQQFEMVKRAQWIGDVMGEQRCYGVQEFEADNQAKNPPTTRYWYPLSLRIQAALINDFKKNQTQEPVCFNNVNPTLTQRLLSANVNQEQAKTIVYDPNGNIIIPAAAIPNGTKDAVVMTSFHPMGGLQVYLSPFMPQGLTVMRGGTWKNDPATCCSGTRMLSDGYGKYENWGFRVVLDAHDPNSAPELTYTIRDTDQTIQMVYMKPGSFIMGGNNTEEGKFKCVEVPKHEVEITKGYYIGKHPITQAQYQAVLGNNPSKSTISPDCPVDNIGEDMAQDFCREVTVLTGRELRLPTEAEWEYACRAGTDTKWFFGNDPAPMEEYAWFKDNSEAKSHPVGQKKPNPWGLYDVYGNVCERCSDKYEKDYYKNSPKQDPTGPSPGITAELVYNVNATHAGPYSLTAEIVTVNYNQRLMLSVNGGTEKGTLLPMPFTNGKWLTSDPVTVELVQGENTLRFWRDMPPQYGLVVKQFILKPLSN
jgi:formylglycine-generating enzyme required for sulfatase activity